MLLAAVDVDPVARINEGVESALASLLEQLPQVGVALAVLAVGYAAARGVAWGVRRSLSATTERSGSFVRTMGRLAKSLTLITFVMLALVVAVPSVDLAAVIGALGIGSIAIGFAFQDILQNTLAGLLILFRQPFRVGDQITIDDHSGTVVDIAIRETSLKTFDGRIVLIPNSDVYSAHIDVQTARDNVRTSVLVGVDYDTDLGAARDVALETLAATDGVLSDPAPQAYYVGFGASSIDLDLRYWTEPQQAEIRRVQDVVVQAISEAFVDADIDIPFTIIDLQPRNELQSALAEAA